MTRLDVIRARLKDGTIRGLVTAHAERDVAWLVETVDAFTKAAALTGHSAEEPGCAMCAALARLEEPDAL